MDGMRQREVADGADGAGEDFLPAELCANQEHLFAEGETEAQHSRCPAVPNQPKHWINPFFPAPSQCSPCAFTQIPPEGCPLLRDACTPFSPAGDGDQCLPLCLPPRGSSLKKAPPRSDLLMFIGKEAQAALPEPSGWLCSAPQPF